MNSTPKVMSGPDAVKSAETSLFDSSEPLLEVSESSEWIGIYKKVAMLGFQAFFVYFITFTLFPGTMLQTKFDFLDSNSSRESWFDISMVTIYAVIDFIGRWMANCFVPFTPRSLLYFTLSRLIHIPISLMIQLACSPAWLFQSDWFRILNISIFGWTQGYNTALVMMFGPEQVKNHEKEKAGIILNFHLMAGICMGT